MREMLSCPVARNRPHCDAEPSPMSFSVFVAGAFEPEVRRRGETYFAQGRVRIRAGGKEAVEAQVRGSRPYEVRLERDGKALLIECDCPFIASYSEPCKHIWATILAAKGRGFLAGGDAPRELVLVRGLHEVGDGSWDVDPDPEGEQTWDSLLAPPARGASARPGRDQTSTKKDRPGEVRWDEVLRAVAMVESEASSRRPPGSISSGSEIRYVVELADSLRSQTLSVGLLQRRRKKDGSWGKLKSFGLTFDEAEDLPDETDRLAIALLRGAQPAQQYWASASYFASARVPSLARVRPASAAFVLEQLCAGGRCSLRRGPEDDPIPLAWDGNGAWQFRLAVRGASAGKGYEASGLLCRGAERMSIEEPDFLLAGALVIAGGRAARLDDGGGFALISLLRRASRLAIRVRDRDKFLKAFYSLQKRPPVELPDDLRVEEERVAPRPGLRILEVRSGWGGARLRGEVSFDYDGQVVPADSAEGSRFDLARRRLLLRDREAEAKAVEVLHALGFRRSDGGDSREQPGVMELTPRRLPGVVPALLRAGWRVEAEGKLYRTPSRVSLRVSSGTDWFDLEGEASYGDISVGLPALLEALARGEGTVLLGDGSLGMLPDEWLTRFAAFTTLGEATEGAVRFSATQVGILDALLATAPEATCDELFEEARKRLRSFEGIPASDPPPTFRGTLRPYQREGLGWLHFLREFGFGGCLADDMGLGKTVQVLALLEARRIEGQDGRRRPSLVVAPRSLIFNWKAEAERFAPALTILDHTGLERRQSADAFQGHDLVLTTYGTLRRDAVLLREAAFDYVILDESQAIKNDRTDTAKAVRLLRGDYRLALSGTPIENHLGELWSLFEFLNPGMLGRSAAFRGAEEVARDPRGEGRALLARALRPFILRRTKQQVAPELPPRTEQTLYCTLEGEQRALYAELRDHYRSALLARVDKAGLGRSKIQVLEALLRLRQAACHPGLLDPRRSRDSSAKLDLILPQLAEIVEEGNKALVFSQFTSLLAIVRDRLDAESVPYAYLDGSTGARQRQEQVARFQEQADCRLFLVSLKAGGLGLNLTAAEYVYLLDPWWNPAVEAQAIDRAHRIGQTKPVIACRLVARDTVEEKILELQVRKKELADAILSADSSVLRNITREDLELLLS